MKAIWTRISIIFSKIRSNFIFLPSIIIAAILLAGIFLISIDGKAPTAFIKGLPYIKIHQLATIRSILNGFLTGLISITVFSFSMVMLVMNQASANYSPRILSWMVGERGNQYILGVYLGTIVLTILLLLQLPQDEEAITAYHFAVLLNSVLTFYCLVLFIKFINRVSKEIQITNITQKIFLKTKKQLSKEMNDEQGEPLYIDQNIEWKTNSSSKSGYLQKITKDKLLEIADKHDIVIKALHSFGYYYLSTLPLFAADKYVSRELIKEIENAFIFYPGERIEDQAFYGFRQLSEIAVKALSPGINDPGTANQCIDYLTHLFIIKMKDAPGRLIKGNDGTARIVLKTNTIPHLIKTCMVPILQYGESDLRVLENLLVFLRQLGLSDVEKTYQSELNEFLNGMLISASKHRENIYRLAYVETFKKELVNGFEGYFRMS